MARFSPNFLDEVLSRTDIVELVARHVELKRAGSNLMGLCPFHHEKSPSFSVSVDKQLYYCFGCGKGGGAFQFLMEHDGYAFPEAVEYLAEKAGMDIPRESEADQEKDKIEASRRQKALDLLAKAADMFAAQLHSDAGLKTREYIKKRQLPEHIVRDYKLGFAPAGYGFMERSLGGDEQRLAQLEAVGLLFKGERGYADRFRARLMFPIRDKRGSIVGFGGRVMGDDNPKYLNSPETPWYHKSDLLYGLSEHRDAIRKRKLLLVVEGYMDVLALAANGLPIGLAPLGTAMGERQLREVFRLCEAPVFCFDGDRAGYQAAWRSLERMLPLLKPEFQPRFLYLPEGEDPDSLLQKEGAEAFEKRMLHDAKPVLETWLLGLRRLAGSGADGVARMAKKADEMLETLHDDYLRQAWKRAVEDKTGIELKIKTAEKARKTHFSLPAKRRDIQAPKNVLYERFMAAIMQKPSRIALLPPESKGFFIDNSALNRIYTRAFSMQGCEENNYIAWVRQLQREFPEFAEYIARWTNQEPVLDMEFSSYVLDMRVHLIDREISAAKDAVEKAQYERVKIGLKKQQKELIAELEEQRRGSE